MEMGLYENLLTKENQEEIIPLFALDSDRGTFNNLRPCV